MNRSDTGAARSFLLWSLQSSFEGVQDGIFMIVLPGFPVMNKTVAPQDIIAILHAIATVTRKSKMTRTPEWPLDQSNCEAASSNSVNSRIIVMLKSFSELVASPGAIGLIGGNQISSDDASPELS